MTPEKKIVSCPRCKTPSQFKQKMDMSKKVSNASLAKHKYLKSQSNLAKLKLL